MESIRIDNALIVTPQGRSVRVIERGTLAIEGDTIVKLGASDEVSGAIRSDHVIDASDCIVIPGLIDSHIHTPLSLLRGLAQDVPETAWMHKTVDPLSRNMTPDDSIIGSKLTVLEAMSSGTTCFCDYSYNMDRIIEEVYEPSGARANVCSTINEFGSQKRSAGKLYQFDEDAGDRKFNDGVALVEKWHGALGGRITCHYGPQAADMMSSSLLLRVREKAIEDEVRVHIHVAQGGRERGQMQERFGLSTIEYLKGIDFLDDNVIAVHCHNATAEELKILALSGAKMVGCPGSIGLIDGIVPPLHSFTLLGGIASIGTDQGPPDGNVMFSQMRYAALLNKTLHRDPTVLPADQIFLMATLDAARVHGLDREIGSLEVGKKADIVILDKKHPTLTPTLASPVQNILANLVYNATGAEVRDVIINGRIIKERGQMLTLDENQVLSVAQQAAERLVERSLSDLKEADSPYLS